MNQKWPIKARNESKMAKKRQKLNFYIEAFINILHFSQNLNISRCGKRVKANRINGLKAL